MNKKLNKKQQLPLQPQPGINPQEMFAEALRTKRFPADKLPACWWHNAQKALRFASLTSLGISLDDFKALTKTPVQYLSLMQVAILNNNLEMRTAAEMRMDTNQYLKIMETTMSIASTFNTMADELRKEVEQTYRELVTANLTVKKPAAEA